MNNPDYMIHYWFRLAMNNFDNLVLVSGAKGFGKSSAAIWIAREYNKKFSFICPHCGNKFYKSVYAIRNDENGKPSFYVPDYVKNDKAGIRCEFEYELNMRTKQKELKRGCGKTHKWSQRKTIPWRAEDFIAYDNEDVIKKVFSLPKRSPLVCDEAIKFAAGMNHMRSESKALKEIFTVIRPKQFLFLMNIPSVSWIDDKYRSGMSSWWLRMIGRGDAVLFQKDIGEAKDPYYLKDVEKAMKGLTYFSSTNRVLKNLKKLPTFFDHFHFPELPESVYDDYELVRNAVNLQRQVEEQQFSNKDMAKIMSWNIVNNWDRLKIAVNQSKVNKVTYAILINEVLCNPLDRKKMVSEPTVRNWLRGLDEYVKTKGKDASIFDVSEDIKPDN